MNYFFNYALFFYFCLFCFMWLFAKYFIFWDYFFSNNVNKYSLFVYKESFGIFKAKNLPIDLPFIFKNVHASQLFFVCLFVCGLNIDGFCDESISAICSPSTQAKPLTFGLVKTSNTSTYADTEATEGISQTSAVCGQVSNFRNWYSSRNGGNLLVQVTSDRKRHW